MNRLGFVSGIALAAIATPALAAGKDAVILLTTNVADQYEDCTNFLAEALRARGVPVVDPSSVSLTYHERTQVAAIVMGPLVAVAGESVSWIETRYNSSRALFVDVTFHDSTLPYGDFTVHSLRVTCSYRCMNVVSGAIVKAGKTEVMRRGEDLDQLQSQASNVAMLSMARDAAPALS